MPLLERVLAFGSGPRKAAVWQTALVTVALVTAVCLLALFTQVASIPRDGTLGTDPGIFAYGGKQILMGKLPYRDFWDHKPPIVFYLNALGILSFGESSAGIWAFGAAYVTLTAVTVFLVLRRLIGGVWAWMTTAVFLLTFSHPQYFHDANFTEVYALPWQFLAMGAACAYARNSRARWVILAGMFTAAAFLLKPTTIGVGVASLLVLLASELRRGAYRRVAAILVAFTLGALIPMLVVAAYWARQGAFSDLWEAVVVFNHLYVAGGVTLKWVYASARFIFLSQPIGTLAQLALVSVLLYLFEARQSAARRRENHGDTDSGVVPEETVTTKPGTRTLFDIAILALPIELILVSIGGKGFQHYYITFIPALSVASIYFFVSLVRYLRLPGTRGFWAAATVAAIFAITIPWDLQIFGQLRPSWSRLGNIIRNRGQVSQQLPPELEYVVGNSTPDQSVLFWGYLANDNFATHRRSPSRYFHVPALLMPGYDNARRWREFLDDLKRDPPELIVGDHDWNPYFIPSDVGVCSDCAPEIRQGMEAFSAYVLKHYELVAQINRLQIFKRKPGQ